MKFIEVEELKKEICKSPVWTGLDAIARINAMPSIDIVFCKECDMSEVYQNDSSGVMARYCRAFTPTRMVADDDFCSYGERKE